MRLDELDDFPAGLGDLPLSQIRKAFPAPTLLRIAGAKPGPLFVSTLLHGNETTSFGVLQHLARRYGAAPPPRDLMILVGNVEAAEANVRFLDGQADYNRVWCGGARPEHGFADQVLDAARAAEPFASIDVHNNTGDNPLYGCVNVIRNADLHLAALFSPVGVYYRTPSTTQSMAFSQLCPAITVECGRSGAPDGLAAAVDLVEGAMRLDAFPDAPPDKDALRLYKTVGRMVVSETASIGVGEAAADVRLRADLTGLNFRTTTPGEPLAAFDGPPPVRVFDEHGDDLTERFLTQRDGAVRLASEAVPAMLTLDLAVIRQDCLGYLMTPFP